MRRRIFWWLGGSLIVGLLLAIWFMSQFERVPIEVGTPPGEEARQNRYLALERLIAAGGRTVRRSTDVADLATLPRQGVLILDAPRLGMIDGVRLDRLLDWVAVGGYLIVVPEAPGKPDPVLRRFEVNCDCSPSAVAEDAQVLPKKGGAPQQSLPKVLRVPIPGADQPLLISSVVGQLKSGRIEPQWRAEVEGRPAALLHFAHGRGNVTMISNFSSMFANTGIQQLQHAAVVWALLDAYRPEAGSSVMLLGRIRFPSLAEWLAGSAWMAGLAGGACLLLWLWSVLPRFGAIKNPPPLARRELSEHLAAIGCYVWRAGGLEHWLDVARASLRARLAVRHPALLALPPVEQARALAKISGRPADLIASAMHGPVGSPHAFTQAMRLLRNLEHTL